LNAGCVRYGAKIARKSDGFSQPTLWRQPASVTVSMPKRHLPRPSPAVTRENDAMKEVTLTIDGACIGNPGSGGWAYILRYGERFSEKSGSVPELTTNNRMEIQAAIEGLRALREPCIVTLITDSTYLMNGITTWRHAWRSSGWVIRRKNNKPVPNSDLWQLLDELLTKHTVECRWVRGHSGDSDNQRCDEMATRSASRAAAEMKVQHDSPK
jgi:ribonuclease HI